MSDNALKIEIETGGGKMKEPSQLVSLSQRDRKMGAIFFVELSGLNKERFCLSIMERYEKTYACATVRQNNET